MDSMKQIAKLSNKKDVKESDIPSTHQGEAVVFFLDEILASSERQPWNDWNEVFPNEEQFHLLLAFSPITPFSSVIVRDLTYMIYDPWCLSDHLQFPLGDNFLHVSLNLRYRCTRNIQ